MCAILFLSSKNAAQRKVQKDVVEQGWSSTAIDSRLVDAVVRFHERNFASLANLCLRNKTQPACQRSETVEPLEVEWIATRDKVGTFLDRFNNGTLRLASFDSR